MALKAIVDKLDDVPEHFRELYTERNGKFEITGIEGMKTEGDVARLTSALEKERGDHKKTKTAFAPLGDRKVEDIVAALDRIPELEALAEGKIDDNKINELVEKRIGTKTGPLQRQIAELTRVNGELGESVRGYQQKERTRAIHDGVREAISKSQGFQSSATEDVLMLAERMFDVTEEGKIVTKDGVGVVPGVEPSVWLTDMQSKRPHWWGTTQGGGAGGNDGRGNGPGGSNPWSADNWNLTEQGKIFRQNPSRADQLARAAGSSIGAGRPPVKK